MRRNRLGILLALLILLLMVPVAMANSCSTDYIVNGSFENPVVPLGVGITKPDPNLCFWYCGSGAVDILVDDIGMEGLGYPAPPDGYQAMYWTGGNITQNTGLTIASGKAYKLSCEIFCSDVNDPKHIFAIVQDQSGNTIASSPDWMPLLPKTSTWTQFTFTFISDVYPTSIGKTLVVALNSSAYTYVDEVTLTVWPSGDLNGDCAVNFADVAVLAANWLNNNKVAQSQY